MQLPKWSTLLLLAAGSLAASIAIWAVIWSFEEAEIIPAPPQPQGNAIPSDGRPNMIVIIADDLGYTDLGSFGSEIDTPNLDALAKAGVRLTQFHTSPVCSPTRAMLLTSVDSHLVGLGAFSTATMASNQKGVPGYEAHLNKRAASIGEIFLRAGYHTYVSGKWHLGDDAANSPPGHGFQRSWVLVDGGAGQFNALPVHPFIRSATFRKEGHLVELPKEFYASDFYTDRLIDYIDADKGSGRPFLGFLSFTAPHWPLQAKADTIKKYQSRYTEGYEVLEQKRRKALLNLGISTHDMPAERYHRDTPRQWNSLSDDEKRYETKRMAVYAAMIDDMDKAIGRLIQHLKVAGKFDNTVFVFLSDNGAEGHSIGHMIPYLELSVINGIPCCDNSYANIGDADSFIEQGPDWARASVGPRRIYKGFPTQGGVISPAFVTYPKSQSRAGTLADAPATIKDILPTLMDYAGIADHGTTFAGREVFPIEGRSLLPLLNGGVQTVHGDQFEMGFQLFGKHGIRVGDWKLIKMPKPYGDNEWKLYNLVSDPLESIDLAKSDPKKLSQMIARWDAYQKRANVILPDGPWWLDY